MDRLLHTFEEELQVRERAADTTSSQRGPPARGQPTSSTLIS